MNLILFSGGVYAGKNTLRGANVRFVRETRTNRALSEAKTPSKKWLCHFFDTLKQVAKPLV